MNAAPGDSGDRYRAMAEELHMEILDGISLEALDLEICKRVPYQFVKRNRILPLKRHENRLLVAVADPLHLEGLEELSMMLAEELRPVYVAGDEILRILNILHEGSTGEASQLLADLKGRDDRDEEGGIAIYDLLDTSRERAPIIQLLNFILKEAIQQGASDIHFEPFEGGMRVRYRIDGVLHTRHTPDQELQGPLITRIKVMAKLDIAERRLPQDGRIKLIMGRREIDFRISSLPVVGGERIVMRILDKGNLVLGLDQLGMMPRMASLFRQLIKTPEGIILVTGPTGSGKTTTLYSAIRSLSNESTNIITVEDPVEYNLPGIAQVAVQHKIGLSFSSGLRSILRQDPDIIMIGEIRDRETAEIAVQSSLTGHAVFSTLHTNDAPSAVTRLVDMGIEPYLISSSLIAVLAQRLVRTICSECKEEYQPDEEELRSLGIKQKQNSPIRFCRGKGCSSCYGSGYRGRRGIYELLPFSNALKRQLVKNPDAIELRELALKLGMVSLIYNGAHLVENGVSTTEEVLRACRTAEE